MTMMVEWTGRQQLTLFWHSVLLGVALGFLFTLFNVGAKRRRIRKWRLLLSDALYFVLAALITFYFSLAEMDGKMHPLLFVGSLVGFFVQQIAIGRFLSRWIYRAARHIRRITAYLLRRMTSLFIAGFACVCRRVHMLFGQNKKNHEKSRKKARFFEKNS